MVLIKIKDGFQFRGEGERVGRDSQGVLHTFWKSSGHFDVPLDLAIKVLAERPQRFDIVNKEEFNDMVGTLQNNIEPIEIKEEPIVEKLITLKEIKKMTKDGLNDWAAKRDYDVNPTDKKNKIINDLIKQIEEKTGKKVE